MGHMPVKICSSRHSPLTPHPHSWLVQLVLESPSHTSGERTFHVGGFDRGSSEPWESREPVRFQLDKQIE